MNFGYVLLILLLVVFEVFFGIVFFRLIKQFKCDLAFKECLLFSVSMVSLPIAVRFSLVSTLWFESLIYILFLILYYITSCIKFKKYIPFKIIVGYTLIGFFNLAILYKVCFLHIFDGWDGLVTFVFCVLMHVGYIIILILINFVIFIVKIIKKIDILPNNQNCKIIDYCIINIILAICASLFLFYCDQFEYNELLSKQKKVVVDYLEDKYPNYEFKIIKMYEDQVSCHDGDYHFQMFGCNVNVIRNEIENTFTGKKFIIDVEKDILNVYNDGFKLIFADLESKKVKKYLKDNYNVSLNYEIDEEEKTIKNIEFILGKNYKMDDFSLFIQEMREVFIYVDSNFYDLEEAKLVFENGNPFCEKYYNNLEYYKTKGTIREKHNGELEIIISSKISIDVDKWGNVTIHN